MVTQTTNDEISRDLCQNEKGEGPDEPEKAEKESKDKSRSLARDFGVYRLLNIDYRGICQSLSLYIDTVYYHM